MAEELAVGALRLECPDEVHRPGPASRELVKYLFSARGKTVLDLCCGTGLFGIAAAKAGAKEVWATDLDPKAVDCTRRNAALNGVGLTAKAGDLFEPIYDRRFDLIVTNPPQTPSPGPARGPKLAGPDGLRYFETVLREAPRHLEDGGQLLTFFGSLGNTKRFEELLSKDFRFRPLPTTRREFTREEMDGLFAGLFEFLKHRRDSGLAEFTEEEGRCAFTVRYYLAMRK
jgi:methylase of polypeptide subunit release factors